MRERNPILDKLIEEGKHVYSFSKLSTIENCPYAAYLTYAKHYRGEDNIYGFLGGITHDALESIMRGKMLTNELPDAIEGGLEQADFLGLSFPKDRKGGDTIRENWVADMNHFARNFKPPKGNFVMEDFFIYKIDDDHFLQGYIDLTKYNSDGSVSVFDWKTSSMYSGDELHEHAKQLIIYAMALKQSGKLVDRVAWYFLKYVTATFMGKARSNSKNKTKIVKNINRRRIVKELEPYIRQDLIENDYDDIEIELLVDMALSTNSLDGLPASIRENYLIEPCIIEYPLNDETSEECVQWINKMIKSFESRDWDDPDQWEPREFTRRSKTDREVEDTFFCTSLCDFRHECPHLADHQEMKRMLAEDIEQFV